MSRDLIIIAKPAPKIKPFCKKNLPKPDFFQVRKILLMLRLFLPPDRRRKGA